MDTPENPFETAFETVVRDDDSDSDCEVLADGRVAHYMQVGKDGLFHCTRCPAVAGKHGLNQEKVA